MMGHRERAGSGAERDVISKRARRVYCYLGKPGVTHGIKKQLARRARKEAKEDTVKSTLQRGREGLISAPWTPDQVDALNEQQLRQDRHPYTCPGGNGPLCAKRDLVATPDGWICECGRYTQDWAWAPIEPWEPSL